MCVQYALVHINVRYVQYALNATKELNVNTFTIQKCHLHSLSNNLSCPKQKKFSTENF